MNQSIIANNLSFGSISYDFTIDLDHEKDHWTIDNLISQIAKTYTRIKPSDAVHYDPQRKKERLLKLIKDYEINGVIFLYYNFCDPDAFESRRLTQFLAQYDIDSIIVQTDPQLSNLQQLTTRIEAFLEI